MWKSDRPSQEDANKTGEDYSLLASEFKEFASQYGPAIKRTAEELGTQKPDSKILSPESYIILDILNICATIARSVGNVPCGIARICAHVLAVLGPKKVDAEVVDRTEMDEMLATLYKWQDTGLREPITLRLLAMHDKTYGKAGAQKAFDLYSKLALQASRTYQFSIFDDPISLAMAERTASEYLLLMRSCFEVGTDNNPATAPPDGRGGLQSFGTETDICSECSDACELLELPFGAAPDQVKRAQHELARNLHPDVWVNKRGARGAEERLKQVNASCEHLLKCRWSGEHADGARSRRRSLTNVVMPQIGQRRPSFWRVAEVFLRAVWRFTKIVLAILLGVVAAAIVLLTIFMALWEHWESESKGQRGQSDLGSMNTKLFSFLESVTWLPRQIWGGLMLVATILFFGLVFAGQSIMEFALSNRIACVLLVCLFGLGLMAWVFQKEWQAEFAPSPDQQAPTTSSTVLGLIVVIASIAGSGWWFLNHQAASPEQAGSATSTSAAPTAHVNSEPTASSPGNGDRQLLWDYTSNEQIPELPEEMKQKLRELIGPVTHHEDDMSFGPELIGAFYSGQPPDSQKVYSVTLPWIDIEGRSHAEGDLSFIVVATGDQLDVYEGQYAGKILSVVRPQGAGADLMLIEYEWSGQGEDQKYLRILSVADHSLKLVTDVGMGLIDDYATAQPLREVADRIYYRAETDGSITILPREHFLLQDGPPKDLGMDSDNADEAFGRLLDRAKLDPKPTDAPLTSPSTATTSASATDALQKFDVVQAIRKSCENGFADSCANLARLHDAGGLANQPAAPATESATDDSVTQPTVLVPAISPAGAVMVQVAAVASHDVADILTSSLRKKGYTVAVRHEPQDNLLHVQIGPFADRKDAEAMRQRVLADGFNATVK